MEYLVVYQDCGEELSSRMYITCNSDERIYTKLHLVRNYGVDEDSKWGDEEVKEALKELKEEVADDNECSISEVDNDMIEEWCEAYINDDENFVMLIVNLNTKEELRCECMNS